MDSRFRGNEARLAAPRLREDKFRGNDARRMFVRRGPMGGSKNPHSFIWGTRCVAGSDPARGGCTNNAEMPSAPDGGKTPPPAKSKKLHSQEHRVQEILRA